MKDLIEKYAQVIHNPALNNLEITLQGFIAYDTMVSLFQYEYAMIRHYKIQHCTVDLKKMGVYAPGVSELVQNKWFSQIASEGIRCVAFVVPENVFGEISMNKAHEGVKPAGGLQIKYFRTLQSAQQWVGQMAAAEETAE